MLNLFNVNIKVRAKQNSGERDPVSDGKEIEYYSSLVNAWIQNRMELDRNIIGLSSLAIGLLMTFFDKIISLWMYCLWLICSILFLGCIVTMLIIFWQNSCLIKEVLQDSKQQYDSEGLLGRLEKISSAAFVSGIALTIVFIAVLSYNKLP